MRKLSLSIILIALIGMNAISQVKFGVRLGLTSSSLSTNDVSANGFKYESLSNAKVGVQGGLLLQVKFLGMFIQPELLLSSTGGEVKVTDLSSNKSDLTSQRFTKLDIPVLVGEKFGPLRLGIGPVASIILNKPSDAITTSITNKYNSATFGFQVGAGLDLWKLVIDLKYEGNLSALGNGVTIGGHDYSFDSRNHQWILGVGWFF